MTYYLLAIFTAFCLAVGYGLASNHVSIWGVVVFIAAGVMALEVGYALTSFVMNYRN